MSNPMKAEFDKIELMKNIVERQKIVTDYIKYGILNREETISKIKELRISDEKVFAITTAELAKGYVPFGLSTNDQLINELNMQIDILTGELIELAAKDE